MQNAQTDFPPFEDSAHTPIHTNFIYDEKDFEMIKKGHPRMTPNNPDTQRWYIETKDNWVYIFRSLKPTVIFKIRFEKIGNNYVSSEAYMNFERLEDEGVEIENYYNCWMFFLIEHLIFKNPWAFRDDVGTNTKIKFTGVHGFSHWRNVNKLGNLIANKNGADKKVIYFFSVLHDYYRENEFDDPLHGERAAKHADYYSELLTGKQLDALIFAVKNHNLSPEEMEKINDPLSQDTTVLTCLDADRLDLPRVGTIVDPKKLFTQEAKEYINKT